MIAVAGYSPVAFDSAETFIEAKAANTSDCVILDVHLPGKSGLELQTELVSLRVSCPVVFITAFVDELAKAQAFKNGAVEFLRKPLDSDHLLAAIKFALESRRS